MGQLGSTRGGLFLACLLDVLQLLRACKQQADRHPQLASLSLPCPLRPAAGKLGEAAGWAGEVPSPGLALQALRRARPVLLDLQQRAASEVCVVCGLCSLCVPFAGKELPPEQRLKLPACRCPCRPSHPRPALQADSGRRGPRGQFAPQWPVEAHFSREYLRELLAAVDAALEGQVEIEAGGGAGLPAAAAGEEGEQPAAKRQRRTQQQEEAAAAAGVQPCLLTAGAHAAYAGSSSVEGREQLVEQADAMLAAAASAAGAAGPAGQGAPVPALSELPAAVLRSHWLLRLQLEWEAGAAETLSLPLLAKRRQQRRWVGGWVGGWAGGASRWVASPAT